MDPLLRAAGALGGDTLKFGGDALLLLFAGDGHARRACAAAYDMQRAMKPFRRRPTDAGIVSLRASSAVASGTVQLFLVGDRFRELMIGGPVTSEVMTLEHEARAGEVRLGRATRAALRRPRAVRRRRDGDAARGAARRRAGARRAGGRAAIPPAACPPALHHHLGPDAESEHRQVTTGFAQFRGLDELLARGAPAAAAELDAFMARVQRALDEHGVTFLTTRRRPRRGQALRRHRRAVGERGRRGPAAAGDARHRRPRRARCACAPGSAAGACSSSTSAPRSGARTRRWATR